MQRTLFLPFLFLVFLTTNLSAQEPIATNINAEPEGNKINIFYFLPDTKKKDHFEVKLSVAIDGNQPIELQTVSGDVGHVAGGQTRYKAVWDVFQDVDAVGQAVFYVEVSSLNKPPPPSDNTLSSKTNSLFFLAEIVGNYVAGAYGGRIGYGPNWGVYLSLHSGDFDLSRITVGALKSIYRTNRTSLTGMAGFGYTEYTVDSYSSSDYHAQGLLLETGLIFEFYHVALSAGAGVDSDDGRLQISLGAGLVF